MSNITIEDESDKLLHRILEVKIHKETKNIRKLKRILTECI